MALTAYPTITFNSGTGSDTAASGAGPATALSGTACAVTNTSTTVTISDAVALGGVASDGSAVLYVVTSSGRRFTRISTVSGSSGSWTLVVQDSVWTSGTGLSWAIGGKRATVDHAGSRLLFSADVQPGWTIATETDQTLTTNLPCGVSGDVTSGVITFKGTSDSPRPVLTQTANAAVLSVQQGYWAFESLKLQGPASGSRGNVIGLSIDGGSGTLTVRDCELGDGSNKLQYGVARAGGYMFAMFVDTAIHDCVADGINEVSGTSIGSLDLHGCRIQANGATGVTVTYPPSGINIVNSLILSNANEGLVLGGVAVSRATVIGNTIHGNGTGGTYAGVKLGDSTVTAGTIAYNNSVTGNSGYGILAPSGSDAWKAFVDFNNFGTGASANTSGAVSGYTAGAHSLNVDPQYTNASSGDYSLNGTNLKALGFPSTARHVGGNPTNGTTSYVDIGAAQRQEAGGGTGSRSRVGFTS